MSIESTTLLVLLSIALSGVICWIGGRKHRDLQWKWAYLFKPEQTAMYVHNVGKSPTLPEKVEED